MVVGPKSDSFKKELKSDPKLIKNPFVCNSATQVRISLDKDPRKNKGNTSYVKEYQVENGNVHMINELDDNLSYTFGNKEDEDDLTLLNMVDFEVPA